MNLAQFHTTKIIPIYSQGISNKFEIKICVTVLKHIMYECEHQRWQALVGGLVACSRENLKKSVQLGAFWHIFMQIISCPESIIYQQAKS